MNSMTMNGATTRPDSQGDHFQHFQKTMKPRIDVTTMLPVTAMP